jgi:hypothetical protein
MTNATNKNLSSFRFLLLGGWTAIKSSSVGSMFAAFLHLTLTDIYYIWRNGITTLELVSKIQSFLSSFALLSLLAILFSSLPAFIGGILLSWLLKRNNPNWFNALQNRIKLGSIIGALAGVALTLFVLIPIDTVGRVAHGGLGYNLGSQIPIYVFYSVEIISIATIAGRWTDIQLGKQLHRLKSSNNFSSHTQEPTTWKKNQAHRSVRKHSYNHCSFS